MSKLICTKDFSPEELRKWQLKLLEILVYFRDFCEEHNLKFTLAAGTLLGAVRHKGFIPWDDDLDVQMPREDYDKLIDLWDKYADKSKFRCEKNNKERCVKYPMAVCRSMDTTCIYEHSVNSDICQGLKIDVEFLDGVPSGKWHRTFNQCCAQLFALLSAERIPNSKSSIIKSFSKVVLTIFPCHNIRWKICSLLEKQIKKCRFDSDCEYVRYLATPLRKKSCYLDVEYVDFEGYKMPIPVGYDEILRAYYGDYMQFPPKEKQIPLDNNIVFYDLDHSYLDYKGKYYCVSK